MALKDWRLQEDSSNELIYDTIDGDRLEFERGRDQYNRQWVWEGEYYLEGIPQYIGDFDTKAEAKRFAKKYMRSH
jgi:hypothetical protein